LVGSPRLHRNVFGSHAASLTRADLPNLQQYPYLAALKAFGVRYVCHVTGGDYGSSVVTSVCVKGPHSTQLEQFDGTVLDGELTGKEGATYFLVLDCLVMSGVPCVLEPILDRLRRTAHVDRLQIQQTPQASCAAVCQREKLRGLLASST
jgi:hypothetical protein